MMAILPPSHPPPFIIYIGSSLFQLVVTKRRPRAQNNVAAARL